MDISKLRVEFQAEVDISKLRVEFRGGAGIAKFSNEAGCPRADLLLGRLPLEPFGVEPLKMLVHGLGIEIQQGSAGFEVHQEDPADSVGKGG